MAQIKMLSLSVTLLFYPPCEVKCELQNGVLTLGKVLGTHDHPIYGSGSIMH